MDFQLTEEQLSFKQHATEVAQEHFEENAFTWEGKFPEENQKVLSDEGLLGIALPEKYGGGGLTVIEVLLAQEAVCRVCPDTAHLLSRSSMGPPRVIAELGNEHLKDKYLEDVSSGNLVMSSAISEEQAGSDAGNMETSASFMDDRVVINGDKMWVGKAEKSGAFLVYARFEDGNIGAVIVDGDVDGFSLGKGYENMHGTVLHEVFLDDVEVPEEQILALGKDSLKQLLIEFNLERCHNAMMCVGCGLNAFDKALEYAKEREQFGQPIAEFQGIEWKFADMAIELDSARWMIYRAAANSVGSFASRLESSMAKVKANEAGQYAIDQALQIHGVRGYIKESPLEYLYRRIRGWRIAGGTVEIHRNGIARELKKKGLTYN